MLTLWTGIVYRHGRIHLWQAVVASTARSSWCGIAIACTVHSPDTGQAVYDTLTPSHIEEGARWTAITTGTAFDTELSHGTVVTCM